MKKNKQQILLLGIVCLLGLIFGSVQSHAIKTQANTAGSITIPSQPSDMTGFSTPTDPTTGYISTQPNAESYSVTGLTQDDPRTSVAVYAGDNINMYGGTNGGSGKTINIIYKRGDDTTTQVGETQGVAEFSYDGWTGSNRNEEFWYELTMQNVDKPTWNYYQIALLNSGTTQYSQFFRVLVLPKTGGSTLSPEGNILFKGQSTTITPVGLDESITPQYTLSSGNYLTQTADDGYSAVVTAKDAVGASSLTANIALSDIALGGTLTSSATVSAGTSFIYTGRVSDQTVALGDSATFTVELPPAVDVLDVTWTVNAAAPPADSEAVGESITLLNVQADAVIQATVTAEIGASGTTPLVVTSNEAQLTVTGPTEIKLSAAQTLLFAGPTRTSTSNTMLVETNLPEGTPLTWHVYEPGTETVSPIATVDENGLVTTTNLGTGNVEVVAEYTDGNGTIEGRIPFQIVTIPDQTVEAGQNVTFTAPDMPPPEEGGSYEYHWYVYQPDANPPGWHSLYFTQIDPDTEEVVDPANVFTLNNVQLSDDGKQYSLRYWTTEEDDTDGSSAQFYFSNVFTLHVTEPGALSLEEAPAFQFGKMGSTSATMISPTIEDMMTGFSGAGTVGDATWMTDTTSGTLKIADTRSTTLPWKLTVGLSTFTNGTTAVNASLQLVDGSTLLPLIETGESSVLYPEQVATGGAFEKQLQAYLSTEPSSDASLGSYSADVTWTLEDTPNP